MIVNTLINSFLKIVQGDNMKTRYFAVVLNLDDCSVMRICEFQTISQLETFSLHGNCYILRLKLDENGMTEI